MKIKIFDTSKSSKILVFIIWLVVPFIVGAILADPHTELYVEPSSSVGFNASPFDAVNYKIYILLIFKHAFPIYIISAVILLLLFRIFRSKKGI